MPTLPPGDGAGGTSRDPDREGAERDAERRAVEAMASFRDRARATNLSRVEVLEDALALLRGGVLTEDARLTACRTAHTVVGSAGTFGFGEASRLARRLESLLHEDDGSEGAHVRAARGLELVAGLRAALAETTGPQPTS